MSDGVTTLASRPDLRTPPSTTNPPPGTARSGTSKKGDAGRIGPLDGVRGVAALVVVLTHALIAVVPVMAAQFTGAPAPKTGTSAWWLTSTPLRIFWAGPEAVILFFALSGFVLAIPAVRYGTRWFNASFYPRRLLRLYIPLWGGLIVAVLIHAAVKRTEIPGATFWLNSHAVPMHIVDFFRSAALLHEPNSYEFTSVLWTLRWELIFSLILPLVLLYPLVTRKIPALSAAGGLACLGLIYFGAYRDNDYLLYLPMFVIGTIMAFHAPRLQALAALKRPKSVGWFFAIAASVIAVGLLTCAYWSVLPQINILRLGSHTAFAMIKTASTVGACMIICMALVLPTWGKALGEGPLRWLGSRSYSLYLVHEPILVTTALVLGGRPAVAPFLLIAVGVSLIVTELFHRAIGDPAIRIARRTGLACNRAFQNFMGTNPAARDPKEVRGPARPTLSPSALRQPVAAPVLVGAHAGGGSSIGYSNGAAHGPSNGFSNGAPHGPTNGHSNGAIHAAGAANGYSNGAAHGAGASNVPANGTSNVPSNGFSNAYRAQSSLSPLQRPRQMPPAKDHQRAAQLPLAAVLPPPVTRVAASPAPAAPAPPPAFVWKAPPARRRGSPPASVLDHSTPP
ncbi:MAG: acyltransferase family protein, partial [Actinomycetota bacterium]